MKCASDGEPRQAFTLIEPLGIIANMAILVAMVLPVLQSAKLQAQEANCINNAF